MAINLVVAITDGGWFEMLRQHPKLPEVNFWSPSAKGFQALKQGEFFLFKLHAPRDMIVGGGIFTHSITLPCSIAWDTFGIANGADSLWQMRESIVKYRNDNPVPRTDFNIGCRILSQPFFLEERDWIPVPKNWASNIVSLKKYDTSTPEGLQLWEFVTYHLSHLRTPDSASPPISLGKPQLVRPRLGQGAFRALITDSYNRRCAVTRERTLPALEAAHIRPKKDGGTHDPKNGLLLRGDIHRLFDAGYVTITPKLDFLVSRRIREEYENGKDYYKLHGTRIAVPRLLDRRPDRRALTWHNDNCFL